MATAAAETVTVVIVEAGAAIVMARAAVAMAVTVMRSVAASMTTPLSKEEETELVIESNYSLKAFHLISMFATAKAMQARLTHGESRSPTMAAFLTMPLNPCEKLWLSPIVYGNYSRKYEQRHTKRTTMTMKP